MMLRLHDSLKHRRITRVANFLKGGPLHVKDLCRIVSDYSQHFEGILSVTLKGHFNAVYALAVLSDGKLASGSWDATVRLWGDNVCLMNIEGHTDVVAALAPLHDGKLASGSSDCTMGK